jgi:hypothetical protein
VALGATGSAAGAEVGSITPIRGVMQIALTVILVPICLWILFSHDAYGAAAGSAASVLLGAIVTFWLKD